METRTRSYDMGPGKETYGKIAEAFDEAFGLPYKNMSDWWRSPKQWAEFQKISGYLANPARMWRDYGRDPEKWDEPPSESIPIFGPFTGAQHEFGGNPFLVAAIQLAGWSVDDACNWILAADAKRRPAAYAA